MELTAEMNAWAQAHYEEHYDLLLELARIPAPSNDEEKRAQYCKEKLESWGAEGVYIDDALNVVYPIGCDGGKPIAVFMAHSDVVFPDTQPLPLEIRQSLAVTVFAPVGTVATALSPTVGGDPAVAAGANSLSIPISICCMIGLLAAFGIL